MKTFLLAFLLTSLAQAQTPAYQPRFVLPGTIRIWGDPAMLSVVLAWEQSFQHYFPQVHFQNQFLGSDTAMGALYSGTADLALLGRESNQTENDGFLHSLQYTPLKLRLMTGSLDTPEKSPAPVFFVHPSNPLDHITLPQADRAFACGYPCGAPAVTTWGDLGLTGPWASRPIHIYTFNTHTGTGLFLLHGLQGESKKLNWRIIREFSDIRRDDGSTYDASQQILEALAHDPEGLATSTLRFASPEVKALPLAPSDAAPAITPTPQTLIDSTYPLARSTYAFVNRPPSQPTPQPVAEFLRFVFSPEGQSLIAAQPGFLPLASADAAKQAQSLQ